MLSVFEQFWQLTIVIQILVTDFFGFCAALSRNRKALAAENLFLRKQLAYFKNARRRPRGRQPRIASSSLSLLAFRLA